MIKLAAGGAVIAIAVTVGLLVSGVLAGADDSNDVSDGAQSVASPTPTESTDPTEPSNPFITDTGVLNSISRDFVPTDPNATYPPEAEEWSDVICEADARVYVDSSGRITEVAGKGREVIIEVGEQIVTEADFSDLPFMTIAVHRVNGQLELGYRQCWTEAGELVPTTAPEDRQ